LSLFAQAALLVRLAREHADAVEKASGVYESGGTLDDVLAAFIEATEHKVDDGVRLAVSSGLGNLSNLLMNAAGLLAGVAVTLENTHLALHELNEKPLRVVLGDDE